MLKTFEDAYALAVRAHSHQRYGDLPYIRHIDEAIQEAISLLDEIPHFAMSDREVEDVMITVTLHDVAEDEAITGVSHEAIASEGYSETVLARLRRLDARYKVGATYQDNIEAMAAEGDLGTIIAKLADNRVNKRDENIARLPPERRSILRRYERSSATLQTAFNRIKADLWAKHREDAHAEA